jgi:hypothetical protein
MSISRKLNENWSFTQVGGGEGTQDGEWLECSEFPTSAHVELLKLKKIPDPVCQFATEATSSVWELISVMIKFLGLAEWDVQCKVLCISLSLTHFRR